MLLESASDLIDYTEFNDEESEGESDNESVMTNIGSIYDEYDDFYDDLECNDAPVRLIASLPHEDPYSFMGEAWCNTPMVTEAVLRHNRQRKTTRTIVYTLRCSSYSAVTST
jgi:hypothetical protein